MIKITLTSSDARNLSEIADSLSQGLDDVLLAVGTELTGYVMEDFEAKSRGGSGVDGTTWAPLSEATIAKKAKRAKNGSTETQIGVDTGLMRASIQPGFASSDSEGGQSIEIDGNEVTIGFRRKYAKYFDEGRPAKTRVKVKGKRERSRQLKELRSFREQIGERAFARAGSSLGSFSLVDEITSGGQPARPLIPDPIPQDWVDAAEEIVEQWVTDLWNQRIKP